MTDQKETATTMWQDQHSGKRGHQLMTEKVAATIPALYANENVNDYDAVLAHAKLFSPYSNWTWYITELDPATGTCFGLVDGLEQEIGYFDLSELAETTVFGGVPAVERDLYWEPRTIGEIKHGSQGDSLRSQETGQGDTMNHDNETENDASDVVNVEEFLFGGLTEETAGDAPADADREFPAAEATDDASDGETADEPDASLLTAVLDAAGDPVENAYVTLWRELASDEAQPKNTVNGPNGRAKKALPCPPPKVPWKIKPNRSLGSSVAEGTGVSQSNSPVTASNANQ